MRDPWAPALGDARIPQDSNGQRKLKLEGHYVVRGESIHISCSSCNALIVSLAVVKQCGQQKGGLCCACPDHGLATMREITDSIVRGHNYHNTT